MPLVQYYYFRSRWRGKMTKARYVASLEQIKERYAEYEIIGPAEMRHLGDPGKPVAIGHFNPGGETVWRTLQPPPLDNLQTEPLLQEGEVALVRMFLRRYVTWCVRTRRYNQMTAAVGLYKAVAASMHPRLRIAGVAT